jgi:outer membrane lipoprotein LolB
MTTASLPVRATGRRARLPALAGLVLLAGCVSAPVPRSQPPPAGQSWTEERAALQALAGFALQGRVAVSAGSDGFNGGLHWQQTGERARIVIDGPLGVGGIRIDVDGAALRLEPGSGGPLDGEAARVELERRFGFELPVASLRYWILGAPDPAAPAAETLGSLPRLDQLQQSGWQIDYPLYTAVEGLWRPKRLTLTRGDARVRVVVDAWSR